MKIAIVGTGYVGLVTGTCFAEMGTEVFCVDVDKNKIDNLKKGIVPIYEPGLDELVARNMQAGRLHFTTELKECLDEVEVLFSAVGTPPDEDGSADLKYVLEVARTVGRYMNKYILVVTKSTVPVGTAQKVKIDVQRFVQQQFRRPQKRRKAGAVVHRLAAHLPFPQRGAAAPKDDRGAKCNRLHRLLLGHAAKGMKLRRKAQLRIDHAVLCHIFQHQGHCILQSLRRLHQASRQFKALQKVI